MKQKTMLLREQEEAAGHAEGRFTTASQMLVIKCPACRALLYQRDHERNRKVCSLCNYHFRLSTSERVQLLVDPGSFLPIDVCSTTRNGSRNQPCTYTQQESEEAVIAGYAAIESSPCVLAMTNPYFKGKRKGWLTAEQVTRAIERAIERRLPVCTIVAGLRQEEDLCSRIQLAKVTGALARLGEARLPYLSILADYVAGTMASFALLGDITLAECSCFINFLSLSVSCKDDGGGPEKDGVPAEILLQRGMLDALVPRYELRSTLARILRFYAHSPSCSAAKRERARPADLKSGKERLRLHS
ncbi:MAG TPA: carboxyl transferase domain-containing protein [Ktedonobacteraceae bacterium]|jgi:acetyl-CoA carboxylase carboxyl transferase subunit beta